MRSTIARVPLAVMALAALLGFGVAALMPASGGTFAAGLLAAVLAIVVASVAAHAPLGPGSLAGTGARAVITRLVPLGAQSDPDARGHARPRAPGALLPVI